MLSLWRNLRDDYREALGSSEAGERVVADMLIYSGMFRDSAAYSGDAMKLAYKAGVRDAVLRTLTFLRMTDEELIAIEKAERARREAPTWSGDDD